MAVYVGCVGQSNHMKHFTTTSDKIRDLEVCADKSEAQELARLRATRDGVDLGTRLLMHYPFPRNGRGDAEKSFVVLVGFVILLLTLAMLHRQTQKLSHLETKWRLATLAAYVSFGGGC